ncbi:hypothetical protein OAK48_01505 [Deltaproteobacteria bacterium]|nr:hypothetical protein [Deltaproteobacteria bacterium]
MHNYLLKISLLIGLVFFLAGCPKQTPVSQSGGCGNEVPFCVCNPLSPKCETKTVIPNQFVDRPDKTGIQLTFETAQTGIEAASREEIEKQLTSLLNQIRIKAENQEVSLFVQCEGKACRRVKNLKETTENFLNKARDFNVQTDKSLADIDVKVRMDGEQLIFEAIDEDGEIGSAGEILARTSLGRDKVESGWSLVTVPTFEDGEPSSPMSFRIMKNLVTQSEYSGTGVSRLPQVGLSYEAAVAYCQKLGRDAVPPNVHVFEYALRQGLILGHRRAHLEIVRLTNEEDEIEGPMINYENDLFDFERALDTMLIFSWRTGDYESSKQTYFQDDLGFRCAYWSE